MGSTELKLSHQKLLMSRLLFGLDYVLIEGLFIRSIGSMYEIFLKHRTDGNLIVLLPPLTTEACLREEPEKISSFVHVHGTSHSLARDYSYSF